MSDPTIRPPDTGGMKDDVEAGPIDEGEDIDEGTPIDEGTDAEPDQAGLDEG